MGKITKILPVMLAVFLIFSPKNASADEDKKYIPAATFNGNAWHRLEQINAESAPMFKTCLVRGIYEGSFALDPQNAYEQYGPWISFGDLVTALDRFYAKERNLQIPVSYALVLIAKNPTGPTPSKTEPPNAVHKLVSLEKTDY